MSSNDEVTQEATRRATEARDALRANEPKEPMLQFFGFSHLPPHLAVISEKFAVLACEVATGLPRNPERTVALRKLLEAKDCAVRAVLFK